MYEKLSRRSDGACETPSGLFAIEMRVRSGVKNNTSWFEYKASVMGPINRVEWAADSMFALLPQESAKTLVLLGYAHGITDEQMDRYNAAVDAAQPAKAKEPTKPATPVATAKAAAPAAPATVGEVDPTTAKAPPMWTAPVAKTAVVSEEKSDDNKEPEIVAEATGDSKATQKAAGSDKA